MLGDIGTNAVNKHNHQSLLTFVSKNSSKQVSYGHGSGFLYSVFLKTQCASQLKSRGNSGHHRPGYSTTVFGYHFTKSKHSFVEYRSTEGNYSCWASLCFGQCFFFPHWIIPRFIHSALLPLWPVVTNCHRSTSYHIQHIDMNMTSYAWFLLSPPYYWRDGFSVEGRRANYAFQRGVSRIRCG